MLCSFLPFHNSNGDHNEQQGLFWCVLHNSIEYPRHITIHAKSLINGLLEKTPDKRLGGKKTTPIRSHPFFSEIDWNLLEKGAVEPPFKPRVVSFKFFR
jgi:hypothetical protein